VLRQASCSWLILECKGGIHAQGCHWLATSAAFTMIRGVAHGGSEQICLLQTTRDTERGTKNDLKQNWTVAVNILKSKNETHRNEYSKELSHAELPAVINLKIKKLLNLKKKLCQKLVWSFSYFAEDRPCWDSIRASKGWRQSDRGLFYAKY